MQRGSGGSGCGFTLRRRAAFQISTRFPCRVGSPSFAPDLIIGARTRPNKTGYQGSRPVPGGHGALGP